MKARRIVGPLIAVLAILFAVLAAISWLPLRRARDVWRAGRDSEAVAIAQHGMNMRLWPGAYRQLLAASLLGSGKASLAQPHLDALRGSTIWFPILGTAEVAEHFFARGRYPEFLLYDAAVHARFARGRDDVLLRAAAQAATGRLSEADATLRDVSPGSAGERVTRLRAAIQQRKEGQFPWITDRNEKPIAMSDVAHDSVTPAENDFAPLVDEEAGELTFEAQRKRIGVGDTVITTLDAATQRAAIAALGAHRGSLVAIDPRTNEILAIASSRGTGPTANLALEHLYEPGSVAKVVTALNAVASGVDLKSMFPYHCGGALKIDGRSFGDWAEGGHGNLASLDEALAQSCNVFFADVGLRLGPARLQQFMVRAGFDGQTNLGLFSVPLGRNVGPLFNRFETAYYAIGLEHATINALHLAMLASTMANRGVLVAPRLVLARRTILGDRLDVPPTGGRAEIATRAQAETVIHAMEAVVNNAEGTGRRAAIEGVRIALKTGTAGKREEGYHALIMAFAPVEAPRIAFGLIIEHSGPAEFAGAEIARSFLEKLKIEN